MEDEQWLEIEAVLFEMLGMEIGLDGVTDVGVALAEIKAIVNEDREELSRIWKNPENYQHKWVSADGKWKYTL